MSGFGSGFGGQPPSNTPAFNTNTTPIFGIGGQTTASGSQFGTGSSAPMFGASPFGSQPTPSQPAQFGNSNLQTSTFGQQSTTPSAFSQPGSFVFGQNSNPTFGKTNTSTAFNTPGAAPQFGGSSLFGKPASTDPSASHASAFGQPPAYPNPTISSTSTSTTSPSPFSQLPSYANATSANASFSGFRQPSSFSNQNVKTEQEAIAGSSLSTTVIKKEQQFGLFGKEQPNVFKAEKQYGTEAKTSLFGKSENSTGLFGKSNQSTTGLFGKPKEETKVLFGRKSESDETSSFKSEGGGGEDRAGSSARQLFGKPVIKEEASLSEGNKAEEGKGTNERRLFRRTLPLKRLRRLSESSSSPGKKTSQESEKGSRTPVQRQVSDDQARKVSIICRQVPTKFNNQTELKRHFGRFGSVTKVFPNVNKMQATIHFKTHEEATEAKHRGRVIAPGIPPMSIFWNSYMLPSSPTEASSSKVRDRPFTKSVPGTSAGGRLRRPPWKHPNDVNEELDSMAGTQDFTGHKPSSQRPATQSSERSQRGPSPGPSSSVESKSEKVSLSQFHMKIATTTTDKAQLLAMRDKFIRQNTKKKVNVDAKAFVGTCPDMCPERERYDREDKRQLNYYEIIQGTDGIHGKNPEVDHRRAVKEYLRSSPDQDQPLPHELRPLPVLHQTMTYLLKEVANQGEDGRWGDWFDFLWNRTRGIRKDITQQQLCDRNAAELIEKCARFHIYCSERLCEEDMHSFDAKINNENLTKCLQTLKEFYVDLETKQKIYCQNEAEFRAYTVLMNLNEGDTLREVQKLRTEVRSSNTMRFSLEVYFALSSNNYIKFFRLLREASFANACIMHRYFPQVRVKALLSMMKGYRPGNKPAQIPLSGIIGLLAFESMSEAVRFCNHYGFETREGDVILDRNKYMEPESAWVPIRSKNYIECKLLVTCGEMINGESFPADYKLHSPISSFDEHDRFVFEGKGLSTDIEKELKQVQPDHKSSQGTHKEDPVAGQSTVSVDVKQSVPFVAPPELIRDAAKVLFWDVIAEMLTKLSQDTVSEVNSMLEQSIQCTDLIVRTVVEEETSNILREVHEEANAEKIRKEAEELEQFKDKLSDELVNGILYDVLYLETDTIAKAQYRDVLSQLKKERVERVTSEIHIDYYEDVTKSLTKEIAAEVFESDVVQRLKEIEAAENAVRIMRTKRYWVIWQKYYQYVKKLKRAVSEFPPSASLEPIEVQNEKLSGHANTKIIDRQFLVGKSAKLTVLSPLEIMKQREASVYKCALNGLKRTMQNATAWQPEDVSQLVYKTLQKKVKKRATDDKSVHVRMHWKILICLPEVALERPTKVEDVATKLLSDWFTRKYTFGTPPNSLHNEKSKVLALSHSSHKFDEKSGQRGLFHLDVCVRSVEGCLETNDVENFMEERTLLGTSGMVFVLSAPVLNLHDPDDVYWSDSRKRLRNILEAGRTGQAISLVIVMALHPKDFGNHDSFSSVSECLWLEDLIEDKWIFDYHFVDAKFDPNLYHGVQVIDPEFYEKVCEGIEWIADRSLPPPSLKVQRLEDFIDSVLVKLFYPPMLQNLKQRKESGYLERNPNSVLELYNSVIDHAKDVVTSSSLTDLSWPVPEFIMKDICNLPAKHWNMPDYLDTIADILCSFRLPEFIISNPESDSWRDAKQDVRNYFADLVGVKSPIIWGNLNSLLKQVEEDFDEKCQQYKGEVGCKPFYVHLPFSKIIPLCIEHKMETIDFRDHNLGKDKMGSVPELRVAFSPTELQDFINPVDWRHQEAVESFKGSPSLEQTLQAAANRQAFERTKRKTKRTVSVDMPDQFKESKKMADKLLQSVRQEQYESESLIKKLEEELEKGNEELSSYGNLSKIEWKESESSLKRRKSDAGLRRRKSEEFDLADKGKRPRKRYSEIGINTEIFPHLSLEDGIKNLQSDVKKFKEEYALHQERMHLDIDYHETLLSKLTRDKLQNEAF